MALFSVTKEIEFDAGHRVPNHKSMCRNPHGHRYRVVATVEGPLNEEEGTSDEGMVQDFSDIKLALKRLVHDKFDHGFIVYEYDKELVDLFFPQGKCDCTRGEVEYPSMHHETTCSSFKTAAPVYSWQIIQVGFIPTAENLAKFCYDMLSAYLNVGQIRVKKVDVWETPTSMATFPV